MKASERHKLKEDKYVQFMGSLARWAGANRNLLVVGAAAIAACAVAIVWFAISRQSSEATAHELLAEAQTAARVALLQAPDKRARAVEAVVATCRIIAEDYPGTDSAPLAVLQSGQLLLLADQPKDAVPYFQDALKQAGKLSGLALLARSGLAQAYEASGEFEKAITQYEAAQSPDNPAEQAKTEWDVGRCYESLRKPEDAVAHYRKAAEFGGNSKWADLARFRLSEILHPAPASKETPAAAAPPPWLFPTDTQPAEAKPPAKPEDGRPTVP